MNILPNDEEVGYEDVDIEGVNLGFEFKEYEFSKDFEDIKAGQKTKNVYITVDQSGNEYYSFFVNNIWRTFSEEEFLKIVL